MNARLTLRRDEVVCAGQGCGTLIATIRTSADGFRQLEMPPGWHYLSGGDEVRLHPGALASAIWQMSKRARAAAEGFRPVKDRRHRRDESAMSALRETTEGGVRGRLLMVLPARAACAHCGKVNVLDATALDVMTDNNTDRRGYAG